MTTQIRHHAEIRIARYKLRGVITGHKPQAFRQIHRPRKPPFGTLVSQWKSLRCRRIKTPLQDTIARGFQRLQRVANRPVSGAAAQIP